MHNTHFIVIDNCESHSEAQERVLNEISDWGNENNWRQVIGSISKEDNSVDVVDNELRFGIPTIDKIVDAIITEINNPPAVADCIDYIEKGSRYYLYMQYRLAEHAYYTHLYEPLDIWTSNVWEWKLDEVGITNMCYDDGNDKYIVAIDMHS